MPLIASIASGKSYKGYTVYQVPKNWKTLKISYRDSITGKTSSAFSIKSTEIK